MPRGSLRGTTARVCTAPFSTRRRQPEGPTIRALRTAPTSRDRWEMCEMTLDVSEKAGFDEAVSDEDFLEDECDEKDVVDTIVKRQRGKGKMQYCVRCYGFGAADDTYENAEHICAHFIACY